MAAFKAKLGFEEEFESLTRKLDEMDAKNVQEVEEATAQVRAQIAELELNASNIAAEVSANNAGKMDLLVKLLHEVSDPVVEEEEETAEAPLAE